MNINANVNNQWIVSKTLMYQYIQVFNLLDDNDGWILFILCFLTRAKPIRSIKNKIKK